MSKIIKINLVNVERNIGENQSTIGIFDIDGLEVGIELYSIDSNNEKLIFNKNIIKDLIRSIQHLKINTGNINALVAIINCNTTEHHNTLYNTIVNLSYNKAIPNFKKFSSKDKNIIILDLSDVNKECGHFTVINERIVFSVDRNGICSKCGDVVQMPKEYFDALEVDSIMKTFSSYDNSFYYPSYNPMSNPMSMSFQQQQPFNGVSQQLNYMPYTQNYSQKSEPEQQNQASDKKEDTLKQENVKKCSCKKGSPKGNKIVFNKFSDYIKLIEKNNTNNLFDVVYSKENPKSGKLKIDELEEIFNSVIQSLYDDKEPSVEEFGKTIKHFKQAINKHLENRK